MRSKRSQHWGSLDHFFKLGMENADQFFADTEYQGSSHIAKYILSFGIVKPIEEKEKRKKGMRIIIQGRDNT